ncbi:MAG: hypothetical protein MUD01_28395, partial [Chloroflexaceae bacterium]|nr:hypothetical protein [Chloroflexaceae bacterium]
MRHELLELLRCPLCHHPLGTQQLAMQGADIYEGGLQCTSCRTHYPIQRRIPHLLPMAQLEDTKKQEMKGWTDLWQQKGMYEHNLHENEDSFNLPYIGGMWSEVARLFDLALTALDLQGNETVLDLGAGQGWASRYFAAKGCRVVASDIVDDEWFGLGR